MASLFGGGTVAAKTEGGRLSACKFNLSTPWKTVVQSKLNIRIKMSCCVCDDS